MFGAGRTIGNERERRTEPARQVAETSRVKLLAGKLKQLRRGSRTRISRPGTEVKAPPHKMPQSVVESGALRRRAV